MKKKLIIQSWAALIPAHSKKWRYIMNFFEAFAYKTFPLDFFVGTWDADKFEEMKTFDNDQKEGYTTFDEISRQAFKEKKKAALQILEELTDFDYNKEIRSIHISSIPHIIKSHCKLMWIVKLNNNGTTYILSPIRISHMDEAIISSMTQVFDQDKTISPF